VQRARRFGRAGAYPTAIRVFQESIARARACRDGVAAEPRGITIAIRRLLVPKPRIALRGSASFRERRRSRTEAAWRARAAPSAEAWIRRYASNGPRARRGHMSRKRDRPRAIALASRVLRAVYRPRRTKARACRRAPAPRARVSLSQRHLQAMPYAKCASQAPIAKAETRPSCRARLEPGTTTQAPRRDASRSPRVFPGKACLPKALLFSIEHASHAQAAVLAGRRMRFDAPRGPRVKLARM
jgi:hypothetical protein